MNTPLKKLCLQSLFAFLLLLLPTVALAPPEDSIYTVSDFFYYYTEASVICAGHAKDLYNLDYFRKQTESLFPPFAKTSGYLIMGEPPLSTVFIAPIAMIPVQYAYRVWQCILLVCLSISLALWTDILGFTNRQTLWATVAVALSGPVWEVIRVSKPAAIVWLAWTLSVWCLRKKQFLKAGIILLPWTIKPQQIMPFLSLMTGARQWKFVGYVVLTTLALFLILLPIFGLETYADWLKALRISADHPELTGPFLHPTLRGQLLRLLGMDRQTVAQVITPIVISAYLGALLLLAILGNAFRQRRNLIPLTVACMPLGIVTSPYCQNYDLILLIPSVFAFFKLGALAWLPKSIRVGCLTLVIACLVVFELPFYTIIHYTYLEHGLLVVNPFFVSLSLLSAIFIWAAIRAAKLNPE
jgi:hypothetical protein